MKAGVVTPGKNDNARVTEIAPPILQKGEVLVRILDVGIDGTDMEINQGRYGEAPNDSDFLIPGHEALGEVEESGDSDIRKGQLVVPMVRRPDDCINCRNGQSDMCIAGNYRECGIKGSHGFLREYLTEEPCFLVTAPQHLRHLAVLTEPASIATKGVTQSLEFHARSPNSIGVALVLGAGSLGLLTTALLRLNGFNTYALDILPKSSLKGHLVETLGAMYLDGHDFGITDLPQQLGNLDLIVEATGNSTVAFQAMAALGVDGVLCLMGVSAGEKTLQICTDCINMEIVLGNKVVFGTVSSNRSHYENAINALATIEQRWPGWLAQLITRRLPIAELKRALQPDPDGIKTVITM